MASHVVGDLRAHAIEDRRPLASDARPHPADVVGVMVTQHDSESVDP